MFDYHGATEIATDQCNNTQYFNYTAGQNYLVVYLQGINRTWEGPKYAVSGVNDLQFTADLLAHIRAAYCVDSNRVYASGKSNGGGFVDTLACSEYGDEFAAFAMASPALYTDLNLTDCGNKRRAILDCHGFIDTVVPYEGRNCSSPKLPNSAKAACVKGGSEPNIDA